MLSRVLRTIREHRLIEAGDRVLCAVSGGPDSLALLHALVELRERLGAGLEVATVDHQLRREAAAEAQAVAEISAQLGLPCAVLPVDVARGAHVSLQDAARRARLHALTQLAAARGCNRVALGHTADDQAETILFRIVRGTGVAGLRGIPYRRGPLVRPLLDVRRCEVLRFLGRRGVAFATDPGNADRRFTRSRVRHEWLPFLTRENPRVVEALLALGRSAASRADEAEAGEASALPAGLPPLTARTTERLRALLADGRGTRQLTVPGGVIEITYGRAVFHPRNIATVRAGESAALPVGRRPLPIPGTGRYHWPTPAGARDHSMVQTVIEIALQTRKTQPAGPARGAATFAAEALEAEGWVMREPRPGDRMRPRGGRGSRKLQDLFVDAKVPRGKRAQLPVLATSAGTILFVPGLRPAEDARPGPEAEAWLEIRVR